MRKIVLVGLMALSLNGFTQNEIVSFKTPVLNGIDIPAGGISGQVETTDHHPAAFVSVSIKENGFSAVTDENGGFSIKGLKGGIYTLEISMIGLKPMQKQI